MNYLMHQNGEGQTQSAKLPDGLKELMSDISREVLREQPENIYEFIAEYLEEMEITREHRGVAENLLNTVIDESVAVYELFKENGMSLEQAKKSAKIIDNFFSEYAGNKNMKRGFDEKSSKIIEQDVCRKIMQCCDLSREQDRKLRKIVQMCFKNFYFREKSYQFKICQLPDFTLGRRAEKTLDFYRRSALERDKLEKAAVVIQSAYRSYFVRKMPKEIQRFHDCATKIQTRFRGYVVQKELKRANAAATKIQAMYRGYKTRKSLRTPIESEQSMGLADYAPISIVACIVSELLTDCVTNDNKELASGGKHFSQVDNVTYEGNLDGSSKEEMAARTIQKVYRGFQERKKISTKIKSRILDQSVQILPMFDDSLIEQQIMDVIDSMTDAIEYKNSY